jgi:ribosome-associated toxin RatA of RatAB toxin-antitoxin module
MTTRPLVVSDRLVMQVLNRMGIDSPSWKSLIVLNLADAEADPDRVWRTWADIDNWPSMSPLVNATQWTSGDPWRPGSEFVAELNVGLRGWGETVTNRVMSVDPGRSAEWGQSRGGLRIAHLWRFEPRRSGGVHIANVAIFHGSSIGVRKPFVAKRWQRLFQAQMDGLVDMADTGG